ncbi:iron complex transport system substrate-binding protein [Natranaerovirga pectinivora]|uniref:Iron complex transport system substrate-binding protein n=1 Tax=Natranaerovirga pectinivora TaxID=682400 RepID=A0A4R3MN19_9FIRM|nr:siderophore ABC transporter substrate-binding protein [Natranaerovirga pectinivora]TCT15665.1 iron complex transport system substrate-binding protein [Natranaerovirga pectinivora]
MFNKKNLMLVAILTIISIVGLTGCSKNETTEVLAEPTETVTIAHELGETTVVKNPARVIVFDYATLDSLNQMDVEIIGLPKSNIPAFLGQYNDGKYEDVGTLFEPNFEKIFELQPDLILVAGRQREVYDELAKIAPTIMLSIDNQNYMASFESNLRALGQIFDKEEFVNNQLNDIEKRINELNALVAGSNKKALIIMANDGALSAYGKNSRFNLIHQEFAFPAADENIEVSNHGQKISFEYILEVNPDIIFVIDRAAVTGGSNAAASVLDNDLVKMTNAYKNNGINYLSSHIWYVASGGVEGMNIMISEVEAAIK